jgi:hypothetical protein
VCAVADLLCPALKQYDWPLQVFFFVNGEIILVVVAWCVGTQLIRNRIVFASHHPIPRRDSISRPIAPVSSCNQIVITILFDTNRNIGGVK